MLEWKSHSNSLHSLPPAGSPPSVQGTQLVVPVLHEGSTCHHQSRQAGDEGRMKRWTEELKGYSSYAYGGLTDALKCTMYI